MKVYVRQTATDNKYQVDAGMPLADAIDLHDATDNGRKYLRSAIDV